jgi:hypothetical protein
MNAQQPAPGRPVGSLGARGRRRQMVAAYVAALGAGVRSNPIVMTDIERCADLIMLAKTARAGLAAGKTTIDDVVKLENAADRAQRRLNLPPPGAAPTGPSLQDYLSRHAEDGDG